eukprot:TRINITY_DN667_c0_g1_i10.p2 TRINITY_DN667_c0_g1~~TRINITY_DN667_c0_g1_i10.p2  ORF type:complete len:623 (+),score=74.76 TRINITY_DN667_c0_g1_i10:1852-3720(+)
MCPDKVTLGIVREGYKIPWREDPPPMTRTPVAFPPPQDRDRFRALDLEVHSLRAKGAVTLVGQPGPGFYARLFSVPKKPNGWRPVLDLSPLNRSIRIKRFKMESPRSIRMAMRQGDWATSVDLQDAYFHVNIHPDYKKFLRFVWEGEVYQFNVPFGLSVAPLVFSKVAGSFASLQRRRGIRLRMYLDDWLNLDQCPQRCLSSTKDLVAQASTMGFQVHPGKSELVPNQQFSYLGMRFDTVKFTVCPTPQRRQDLVRLLHRIMAAPSVSLRTLHKVLGSMESMSALLPLAKVYKRPLQRATARRFPRSDAWEARTRMGPWFPRVVRQWLDTRWLNQAVPIRPNKPRVFANTDASLSGWGAHCIHGEVSGTWSTQETSCHINWLELQAIFLALQHFQDHIKGKWVVLCADNSTCLAYIRHQGGTTSISLSMLAEEILLWSHARDMILDVEFIPGKLNVLADQLSRKDQILPTEWTIATASLQPVWKIWGKPHIDLFATKYSSRLPLYVSPMRDPEAVARNAFSIPWQGRVAYAYPPTSLIPRVLEKYRGDRPRLILVTPDWHSQAWYPELLNLTHAPPRPLNLTRRTLVQPRSGIGHHDPTLLNLTAWLLCEQACEHRVTGPHA